jgi:predicted tellurium resistance membrane protein TerC
MGYIADAPNKHQRIIYLIIAIIIWYGFSMLIGDIQGSLGGNGKLDSGIVK